MNLPRSQRLRLQPLSVEEILHYLKDDFSFEDALNLVRHPRVQDEYVKKKLSQQIVPKIEANPNDILFHTLWVTIDTTINTAVAGIVFKGPPNENGEVELGAGTFAGFMNRGYMTETTKLLCEWALKNAGPSAEGGRRVKKVVATCSPENVASQRTLEKSGFQIVKKEENDWRWEIAASKT